MANEAGKYKKQKNIFRKFIKPVASFANKWIVDPVMTYTGVGGALKLANRAMEGIGNAGAWVSEKMDAYRKEQEALPTFSGSFTDWGSKILGGLGSALRYLNWPRKYINQLCGKYQTSIILSDTYITKKSNTSYKGDLDEERDGIKFNIGEGKNGPKVILLLEDDDATSGKFTPVDINNPKTNGPFKDVLIQSSEGSNIVYLIFQGCEISNAVKTENDDSSITYAYKDKDVTMTKRIFFPTRKIKRIKLKKNDKTKDYMLKIYLNSFSRRIEFDRNLSDD